MYYQNTTTTRITTTTTITTMTNVNIRQKGSENNLSCEFLMKCHMLWKLKGKTSAG